MKGLSFQDHSPALPRALSKLGGFQGWYRCPNARTRVVTSPAKTVDFNN